MSPLRYSILLLLLLPVLSRAQQYNLPMNNSYRVFQEWQLYDTDTGNLFFPSVKPYRKAQTDPIWGEDGEQTVAPCKEKFKSKWLNLFWNKCNNEHLIHIKGNGYNFHIDPLFRFEGGKDFADNRTTWTNTRGFRLEGTLGKTFSFSSRFYENQAVFPTHLHKEIRRSRIIAGEQYPKTFKTDGFDWYWAEAYVSYTPSKYFNIQFGNPKLFLGDGYRSLLLSDHSSPYLNLKLETQFWRIKYVNIWAQTQDMKRQPGTHFWNKKWTTSHYLSWQVTPRWNVSLFETVIWDNGTDSTGYRGFDWHYLNPVIFYRAVEYGLGSPDNVLLGLNTSLRLGKKHILYSQFILDEFLLKEIKDNKDWWGNKYGLQIGYKAYDFATIPNLYFQIEYNVVRPYTYSHWSSQECYGNLNQPLAHPSGANFREVLARIAYHHGRWFAEYHGSFLVYGTDYNNFNYGQNIFQSYRAAVSEYGNTIGQGLKNKTLLSNIKLSYLVNPSYNFNIFISYQYRRHSLKENSGNTIKNPSRWLVVGLSTAIDNFYRDHF